MTTGTGPSVPGTTGGFGFSDTGAVGGYGYGGASEPLVLNLSGGSVHTTDLASNGISFDMNGTGHGVRTGWILPGEAFLVSDSSNIPITSGAQMIANFGQLSAWDGDHDGQLSASEADAAGLKLWLAQGDAAGNGAGALESLGEAGIASIGIQARTTGTYDNGNLLSADSSFVKTDGTTGDIADTFLMNGAILDHGMIYDTAQGLTIRGTDGSAVTLLTGTGLTVDAGASGLAAVIDAGTGNTLTAGSAQNAVLIGGDNSSLMAGGAQNAVLIGYGDDVTEYGNGGTDTLVTLGDHSTIDTAVGSTNQIYVEGNASVVRAGPGVSSVTMDGDADTLFLGRNGTAALNGAGDALNGGLGGGDVVTIAGQNAVVGVFDSAVTLADGVSATVSGTGNAVTGGSDETLTLGGSNSTASLTGTGNSLTIAGTAIDTTTSQASVAFAAGASGSVTGDANTIAGAAGSTIGLAGQTNWVTADEAIIIRSSVGSRLRVNHDRDRLSRRHGPSLTPYNRLPNLELRVN